MEHGNVFAIPFMGPLSAIVNTVLPGLGFDVAHQATANFLTDRRQDLHGQPGRERVGIRLFGGGWLGYTNDTMNFRVRLNSRGLPGAVLYPGEQAVRVQFAGAAEQTRVASARAGGARAGRGEDARHRPARADDGSGGAHGHAEAEVMPGEDRAIIG